MKSFVAVLMLFSLSALVLPGLTAQDKDDAKKDVEKKDAKDDKKGDEKKGDDKKGEEKKDEKKDDTSKKSSKKIIDPEEEKIIKGTFPPMRARIQNMDPNSAGEFTVQLPYNYPAKVQAANQWAKQQMQLKSPYVEVMTQFKMKMSQANQIDVRTGTGMKVRTMFFPMEYDDKGNLKRPTAKQIAAMKGNSKLPGFPAQYEALKAGQIVDLYLTKVPTAKKAKDNKKKVIDDDPEDPLLKPEVLMVVVVIEAQSRP